MVQAFASGARPGTAAPDPPSYDTVRETMTRLIGDAEGVAHASREQGFEDLAAGRRAAPAAPLGAEQAEPARRASGAAAPVAAPARSGSVTDSK